jgi:hypothetical protein
MKLKYLFIALASSLCLFASCEKEEATSLDSIKLDKTYLSIPAGGGSATLTIDAKEAWSFAKDIVLGKDDNKNNIYGQLPAWLKASTLSGGAGKATVTFSADPIDGGREQEMHILVAHVFHDDKGKCSLSEIFHQRILSLYGFHAVRKVVEHIVINSRLCHSQYRWNQ